MIANKIKKKNKYLYIYSKKKSVYIILFNCSSILYLLSYSLSNLKHIFIVIFCWSLTKYEKLIINTIKFS